MLSVYNHQDRLFEQQYIKGRLTTNEVLKSVVSIAAVSLTLFLKD